jgi:AcrR family transcriptional regulator
VRRPRSTEPRDRIIDAFLALVAERGFASVGLADIATASGVPLAEMRALFAGKLAILAGFSKRIDQAVLAAGSAEGEGARDRLFDVFMRRLDALAPHKAALKRIAEEARRNPGLASVLHAIAGRTQVWMRAAAGISNGPLLAPLAVEGGALLYLRTVSVWLRDDDPDLARTMKALDEGLRRGERAMGMLSDACAFLCRLGGRGRTSETHAA